MTFQDQLLIVPVELDVTGDAVLKDGITVPAIVEAVSSWSRSSFAEVQTGGAVAFVEPWHQPERLTGCEAEHEGIRYRITNVRQLGSLLGSEPDHCELTLERLAPREDDTDEEELGDDRVV